VIRSIRRTAPLALILSTLTACDNVEWAGASYELQPPPKPDPVVVDTVPEEDDSAQPIPLPEGPILALVEVNGDRASLIPLAEVTTEGLAELADEDTLPGFNARFVRQLLAPGSVFSLYLRGIPVGRMVLDGDAGAEDRIERDPRFCFSAFRVPGFVELAPSVTGVQRFLALAESTPVGLPRGTPLPPSEATRGMSINSMRLFEEQVRALEARWPTNIETARRDLQLLDLGRGNSSAIASTFQFRDQLQVGEPQDGSAYSLFILGENPDVAYNAESVWYRPVSSEGKGAPLLMDMLDWDGDGAAELLLDVLGAEDRWFAVVEERRGSFERTFQHACGSERPGSTSAAGG